MADQAQVISQLRSQLDDVRQELETCIQHRTGLQTQRNACQAELKIIKENASMLKERYDSTDSARNQAEQQNQHLLEENARLAAELNKAQSTQVEIDTKRFKLQQDLKKLKATLAAKQEELERYQNELKTTSAAAGELERQLIELRTTSASERELEQSLTESRNALTAKQEELNKLQKGYEYEKSRADSMDSKMKRLASDIRPFSENYHAALEEMKRLGEHIQSMADSVGDAGQSSSG